MTPPTNPQPDLALLAKGLTKAQRATVLRGYSVSKRGMWPLINGMVAAGLLEGGFGYDRRLTPLGLALRTHLQESQK